MKLFRKEPLFADIHRSGWPYAWAGLNAVASGKGILLDDFTDGTFHYHPANVVHQEPWVGIFHHPVNIDSPLDTDYRYKLRTINTVPYFRACKHLLRGAIALCPDVGAYLLNWLNVPVLVIKHPSDPNVQQWLNPVRLWQVGYFLRNLRFINCLQCNWLESWKSRGFLAWHQVRDRRLKNYYKRYEVNDRVKGMTKLTNAEYDKWMSTSVVAMQSYGAAANNVVIECIARSTPILVNRLLATEYYLGKDYPLFYSTIEEANDVLTKQNVKDAFCYLKELNKSWLDNITFSEQVNDFCNSIAT